MHKFTLFLTVFPLALFCLLLASCGGRSYSALPSWVTAKPADQDGYRYFVGKGLSRADAIEDLTQEISRFFGIDVNSETKTRSLVTSKNDRVDRTASAMSQIRTRLAGYINIMGMEWVEDCPNGDEYYVLYKWPVANIKAEQQRRSVFAQSSDTSGKAQVDFLEAAGDSNCAGMPLEIVTTPEGADFTLNGGVYRGRTPIRLRNVCTGDYNLIISKNGYESISKKLSITPAGSSKKLVIEELVRKGKIIEIRSQIRGVNIEVNGELIGKTPVRHKFFYAEEYTIRATHPQIIPFIRVNIFDDTSKDTLELGLKMKPSQIDLTDFRIRNPDVIVRYRGEAVRGNILTGLDASEQHILLFEYYGKSALQDIKLTPGETTYIGTDKSNLKFR
ncbi:MAG: PEGA domain-containing protein [Deltaproteobacteria bacterium]|nr:PEGA domain-containing protein [Deltaproteobacteria bacterium]